MLEAMVVAIALICVDVVDINWIVEIWKEANNNTMICMDY